METEGRIAVTSGWGEKIVGSYYLCVWRLSLERWKGIVVILAQHEYI